MVSHRTRLAAILRYVDLGNYRSTFIEKYSKEYE